MNPMRQPTVRRFFPGGNTMGGFYSYYQYLWRPLANPSPARVWIIKGGPGTGKSVLMQRIADEMHARGYDLELHHCSADPDSVDGVVIPALGAAIVDGTAPHVIDPAFPGAVETMVNLGDFWDGAALRRQRADIEAISARYKGCYASAYNYLAAAGVIHDEWRAANAAAQDWGKVHQFVWGLLADVLRGKGSGAPGYVRKLFATAITPEGFRHHLESVFGAASRRIVLAGEPGTGKSMVVSRLAQALSEHGMAVEVFHCGLRPEEPEHLFAPEVGLAVVSSEEPHRLDERDVAGARGEEQPVRTEVVDLGRLRRPQELARQRDRAETAARTFWDVMGRAEAALRRASALHDELEALYGPHMDFDGVEELRGRIVEDMLALADETGSAR